MVTLYHTNGKLDAAVGQDGILLNSFRGDMVAVLFNVAKAYPSSYMIWCDSHYKDHIDMDYITSLLVHKNVMLSQSDSCNQYFSNAIHYVEESPFLKINNTVVYPTWQMHSKVGAVHAHVLNQCILSDFQNDSFTYFLNSIAKSCQSQGLFCYQLPPFKLGSDSKNRQASSLELYKFIKQHYKSQWVLFLFTAQLIFDKKIALSGLLSGLLSHKKKTPFTPIPPESPSNLTATSVDVIIPTMGREKYLHNVLKDFAEQTHLPEKIIIVEQNADIQASSNLDYLTSEVWPFDIAHTFIHQTGACNARNKALEQTTADWVFFADDDNRFDSAVIKEALQYTQQYGVKAITTSYLQKDEKKIFTKPKQWTTFGAGNSFVLGTLSRKLKFNTAYEYGYGEDADYGMQLRNLGVDIIYHPDIELLHLKAPVGGFRQKIIQPWDQEAYVPKPSPTVMLFKLKHRTKNQVKGYKLQLFLKMLKSVPLLEKVGFISHFKKRWKASVQWANYLNNT